MMESNGVVGIRRAALFSALFALATAAAIFSRQLGETTGWWVSNIFYQAAAVLAAGVLIFAARRLRDRERIAWMLIGFGVLALVVGDLTWTFYDLAWGLEPPYPGPPEVFYLASYPLWFIGIMVLPHAQSDRLRRLRLLLDGLVVTATIAGFFWAFLLVSLNPFEGIVGLELWVTVAYPLLDCLLIAAVVLMSMRALRAGAGKRFLFLIGAFAATAVADVFYMMGIETYEAGVWYDGVWVVSYGAFSLAAYWLTRPNPPFEPRSGRVGVFDLALSYGLLLVLMLASGVRIASEETMTPATGLLLVATAVTIIIVMARQALVLSERREIVERERQELLAAVSHELRNPLTAVQGFVDMVIDGGDLLTPLDRHSMLHEVRQQTKNLGRIVSDLVEVSRNQITGSRLEKSTFDVSDAIDEAIIGAGFERSSIELELVDTRVTADRQRIVQMLVNYLTNARRYGGGRVRIVSRRQDGEILVEVHDEGSGVPVKYQKMIWERFERGAQASNTEIAGTGIGLALVRALAEAHGGRVGYRTSPALGGACFFFALPDSTDKVSVEV